MTAWEVIGTIVWFVIGILWAAHYLGSTKNVEVRKPWLRRALKMLRWTVALVIVALGPALLLGALLYGVTVGPCKELYKRGIKAAAKRQRESQQ